MTDTQTKSMYEKVGGEPAVEAVVADFYERVLTDDLLAPFFDGIDLARLRRHQIAFVAMALGGPKDYQGRAMGQAHEGMDLEDQHFDAVAGHLEGALLGAGVSEDDAETILGVVAGLRDDVLGD